MGRRKKYEEGTADAFRKKKQLSKITIDDATAMMEELDESYTYYRELYDNCKSRGEKERIEEEYLDKNASDIDRIKYVAKYYWELVPGLRDIIDDVYFNMKYTQMIDKRELMAKMKGRKNEH